MSERKENKTKQTPKTPEIPKSSITRTKAAIWIGSALLVGFLGGIWFGDHAQKNMFPSSVTMPMNMDLSGNSMQGGMAPGPVNLDKQEAIKKMEQILASDPNNLELRIHLGNLYYDTDNPQKAVDNYEKALALDRKNPDVLTDCAVMYRRLKQYDKALAYLKDATRLSPTHYQSWYNLGIVYREDFQQYQNAINTWNQLLKNMPDNPHASQIKQDIAYTKKLL